MRKLLGLLFLSLFLPFDSPIFASNIGNEVTTFDSTVAGLSIKIVFLTSLWALGVFLVIYLTKNREELKKYFFAALVVPVLLATTFLVGSTVYLNTVSETKGPVHWHADFEFFYCGTRVDLKNPTGFSNKIGTPTFHEHNDSRIHVEGVVLDKKDISFGRFVQVIGGKIDNQSITLPATAGDLIMLEGDQCPDGSYGEVNAFLYSVQGNNMGRVRFADINSLSNHVLTGSSSVPPGDCIIIEFGEYKSRSDKLCESYRIQILKGKLNDGS